MLRLATKILRPSLHVLTWGRKGVIFYSIPRRCGGTGRRKGLKIPRPRGHTGSSPVTGTTSEQALYRLLRLFSKVRARSLRCSSFPNRTRCRWAPVWDAALRAAFYIRGNIDFNCPSQQNGDPVRGCRFVLLWIWKPAIDKAAAGPCSRRGLPAEKRTHPRRCAPFRLSPGAAARQLVCRPANGWFIAGGAACVPPEQHLPPAGWFRPGRHNGAAQPIPWRAIC